MPIYEYTCPKCGDTFELRRPMSQATEPASCPTCHVDAPRAISRLARVSKSGSDAGDFGGGDDFGGDMDFGGGGHSHDHGAPGHSH